MFKLVVDDDDVDNNADGTTDAGANPCDVDAKQATTKETMRVVERAMENCSVCVYIYRC